MPKHFFFDLDNTLTRSKSLIAPEHVPILRELIERTDVIVVSGHPEKDIRAHLKDVIGYYIMGQNGNVAQKPDGTVLWKRELSPEQLRGIYAFIEKARKHLAYTVRDENDIVENRGAQVAFSLIGHHEDQDIKDAFDPDHAKRKKLIEELRMDIDELQKKYSVDVLIAGTTNLDIIEHGKNKGYNIAELIKTLGWKKEDCIYIGDALFPGGNDATVVGVIPTHPVKDYRETYEYLSGILSPQ